MCKFSLLGILSPPNFPNLATLYCSAEHLGSSTGDGATDFVVCVGGGGQGSVGYSWAFWSHWPENRVIPVSVATHTLDLSHPIPFKTSVNHDLWIPQRSLRHTMVCRSVTGDPRAACRQLTELLLRLLHRLTLSWLNDAECGYALYVPNTTVC